MDLNENIVTGTTKSGIEFKIDRRIKDDVRTVYYLRQLKKYKKELTEADPETAEAAIDAVYSLMELIFGNGEGLLIFMNEVAAHHNGVAAPGYLWDELNEILEACDLKNSSSSQKP